MRILRSNINRKEIVTRISRIMKAQRIKLGLSQQAVAIYLGTSQTKVSMIENGRITPRAHEWTNFCHLADISYDCITHEEREI